MSDRKAPPPETELSPRDMRVLRAIIQDYITTAEPVGSRTLARGHGLDVSPATVRNVMSDLEELGFLAKPHTSAGRVPTPKAFRFYVDALLEVQPLGRRDRGVVDRAYEPRPEDLPALLQQTGRALHQLTHHVAVVASPRLSETVLSQLSFVRLRENRVLAVLVTEGGIVQNRVLVLDGPVDQRELDRVNRYLEEVLAGGGTLSEVRARIQAAIAEERAAYDALISRALDLGRRALEDAGRGEDIKLVVEGQVSILDVPEFAQRDKVRRLLEALEEKQMVLEVLARAEHSPGIRIFIGAESDLTDSEDVAAVVATYRRGERTIGALGVIGPTRMNYSRIIPYVEYTATTVSRLFDEEIH